MLLRKEGSCVYKKRVRKLLGKLINDIGKKEGRQLAFNERALKIILECIRNHEDKHQADAPECVKNKIYSNMILDPAVLFASEITAWSDSLRCYDLGKCNGDKDCELIIKNRREDARGQVDEYTDKMIGVIAEPPDTGPPVDDPLNSIPGADEDDVEYPDIDTEI